MFLRAAVAISCFFLLAWSAVCSGSEPPEELMIADFESLDGWRGLEPDRTIVREGKASGLWRDMPNRTGATTSSFPHDWSHHTALRFWMHNARQVEARFMLILRSENPATEGPDYYGLKLRLDRWTGWKELTVPLSELSAAREPLGWNQIQRIDFTASGWGNEPHPDAEVRFDSIRLVAIDRERGPRMSDEQLFAAIDLDRSDMADVREAVERGDLQAAKAGWLVHLQERTRPLWKVDEPRDREELSAADRILKHVIKGYQFGPEIDWRADPHDYREWTYAVNRFYHWRTLAEAYWDSGDESYAEELCEQWSDWVEKNPVPLFTSGNSSYTWRTIECGIRQSTTWPDCLYRVLESEHFTPDVAAAVTKSMVEHARHLMAWPSRGGNWLTMESNGLGTIGILLPEMKESADWRQTGLARQYEELDNQVYPDGSQIELTTGYHQVSLRNFLGLASTAILNDVPLPGDYYDKLRGMFEYNLYVQMPDGRTPALNDGGTSDIAESMQTAFELYGDPVFEWAASRGRRGTAPDHTSHYFPYAGQMVMRSGWEPDAHYLIMDAGPYGYGHQHEDKLSLMVYAFGKVHLVDPGNYHYDASSWRRYTIDTPAHNTVMVDGQPQRRRRLPRETYVVAEPISTNRWQTSERLDYASGQYDDGYGDDNAIDVVHRRQVLFVKPTYWLVVDSFSGDGDHGYDSLFHFDADEVEIDAGRRTVRTIDPGTSNCLIAAAGQEAVELSIVRGQTEPTVQGFIARQRWRPSWKAPDAQPPDHGKREIPTAVFNWQADGPTQIVYAVLPYAKGESPSLDVTARRSDDGTTRVNLRLPRGIVDEIVLGDRIAVTRTSPGGKPAVWATLEE